MRFKQFSFVNPNPTMPNINATGNTWVEASAPTGIKGGGGLSFSILLFDMANLKRDVFPDSTVSVLKKLEYPERNFKYVASSFNVFPFIIYINEENSVYYKKLILEENYLKHLQDVGKGARCFRSEYYNPDKITWQTAFNKLKRPTTSAHKKNVDVRTGFKYANNFLVKSCFTFGQRFVHPGTAHVYQTLEVPILLYFMGSRIMSGRTLQKKEKIFPAKDQFFYNRRVLPPNGCYRIPPGIRYVILTVQKTLFSVQLVHEKMQFPHRDPIREKLQMPSVFMYDKPIKTPRIEDEVQDLDPDPEPEQQTFIQETAAPVLLYFQTGAENILMPPPPQFFEKTPENIPPQQQFFEKTPEIIPPQQQFFEKTPQQQFFETTSEGYEMPPPPPPPPPPERKEIPEQNFVPVTERIINIVNPNFIEWFRSNKYKILTDPKADHRYLNDDQGDERPLDLSVKHTKKTREFDDLLQQDVNMKVFQELLDDLKMCI